MYFAKSNMLKYLKISFSWKCERKVNNTLNVLVAVSVLQYADVVVLVIKYVTFLNFNTWKKSKLLNVRFSLKYIIEKLNHVL
jgi:hypothetical protein